MALGLAQMFGAVVSLTLLFLTGVNTVSLTASVLTAASTALSVLLFGSWRKPRG